MSKVVRVFVVFMFSILTVSMLGCNKGYPLINVTLRLRNIKTYEMLEFNKSQPCEYYSFGVMEYVENAHYNFQVEISVNNENVIPAFLEEPQLQCFDNGKLFNPNDFELTEGNHSISIEFMPKGELKKMYNYASKIIGLDVYVEK